jgi:putative addiction module component (TIGR02574 family)
MSLDLDAILASMSERARKLLNEAMELPLSERAALAVDLIASLDGEPDKDVEAAWAAEVSRRARESGDEDVPWETVSAEMLAGTSS